MSPSDAALLERYATSGDAESFAELASRYRDFVYSAALRVLRDAAEAEDVTQECFIRLARNAGRIKRSLAAWLHRTALNIAIDAMRRNRSRRQREQEAAAMAVGSEAEASWEDIENEVDRAIDRLPDDLREVILLHFLHGKTQATVANELGISQATVSARAKDGIERLRQQFRQAGITLSAAALAQLLSTRCVEAAPASVIAQLGKLALVGVKPTATATGPLASLLAGGASSLGAKVTCVLLAASLGGLIVRQAVRHPPSLPSRSPPGIMANAAEVRAAQPMPPLPDTHREEVGVSAGSGLSGSVVNTKRRDVSVNRHNTKRLAPYGVAAALLVAQAATTSLQAQPLLPREGGAVVAADREPGVTRQGEAADPALRAQARGDAMMRRLNAYWLAVSFDLNVEDPVLLELRGAFMAAREAYTQAVEAAKAQQNPGLLADASRQIVESVEAALKQTLTAEQFARLVRPAEGEGGETAGPRDGAAPETTRQGDAEGGPPTAAPDAEGAVRPGPRDGQETAPAKPRDGEGGVRTGTREGEGTVKPARRDGEGTAPTGPREGDGTARPGPREG